MMYDSSSFESTKQKIQQLIAQKGFEAVQSLQINEFRSEALERKISQNNILELQRIQYCRAFISIYPRQELSISFGPSSYFNYFIETLFGYSAKHLQIDPRPTHRRSTS